ncbi:MAG: Uma2 family endonuclease [Myxococcales bacterium]|nr:Uma2 family endonuclease [Myxococcales bacterium]
MAGPSDIAHLEEFRPPRRRWTREEFERAAELGLFKPEERLELIAGEMVHKMTPQTSYHASAVRLVEHELRRVFPGHVISVQLPLALGPSSEPEPDVSVAAGSLREFTQAHPTSALLLVEVADTTLTFDRTVKAGLYAEGGIADYWILNLRDRVLEVHREPSAMAEQPLGHHYRSITRHTESESVSPLAAPTARVAVADLLP